jgi:DNA ligase (NAD+)
MKNEVAEIVAELERANEAYHNAGVSHLSDDAYDALKARLHKLQPKHPFLKKVGAVPKGEKVRLPYYLGSLDKIRDDPKHLSAFKKKYPGDYMVSDKLDGISALYVVKGGEARLYTRGDGTYGQDISHLLSNLSLPRPPAEVSVRGELMIRRADWKLLSHKGANARNVVAGTVNAKHPDPEILRHLVFVAYELLSPKELPSEAFVHLKQLGFETAAAVRRRDVELDHETLSAMLLDRRANSPYECDGLVVRHDAVHPYPSKKNPPYAFAFKSILTHDEAEVIVQSVEWNVSKDGFIKPTLLFEPVVMAGVRIQRATGFNAQFIEKHQLGPGARVVIIRSGDVIPHVVRVVSGTATGKPSFPEIPFEWTETHVDIIATGEKSEAQHLKQLGYAVKQLDIKFMAEGTLKKIYDAGMAEDLPALLHLTEADLLRVPGIQTKGAKKLYDSLQATLNKADCLDYMNASGVFGRGMGRRRMEALVAPGAYPEILQGVAPNPTAAPLRSVEGMRPDTVRAVLRAVPEFLKLVRRIHPRLCTEASSSSSSSALASASSALPAASSPKNTKLNALAGQQVVLTGFRNAEMEALMKQAGIRVATGVSKKVSLVIAADPEADSSKLVKARELNIPIVSKDAFVKTYAI